MTKTQKKINKMEISNLYDKPFKVIIIKMLIGFLEIRMHEYSENYNKKKR